MLSQEVRTFLDTGVALVPYPEECQRDIATAISELRQFLFDQPEQWRNIDRDGLDEPEHGWLPKEGEEHDDPRFKRHDRKDMFHFRTDLADLVRERGGNPDAYINLMRLCEKLLERSMLTLYEFARELDEQLPGYGIYELMLAGENTALPAYHTHTFRLLVYQTLKEQLVGKFHTDRGLMTLHGNDSGPGLIAVDGRSLRVERGKALVFAGDKMEAVTNGAVPALEHGVENTEKQRWAGVCFAHSPTDLPFHYRLWQRAGKEMPAT